MKQKQQQIIDLDSFNEVSLYQLVPAGTGMGLSHLKTLVDSALIGRAKLNSLLITGKEGLKTHASALLRALGIEQYNEIDALFLHQNSNIHQFFSGQNYDAYIVKHIDQLPPIGQQHLVSILNHYHFAVYNYQDKRLDPYVVLGLVIMTTKDLSKVPTPVKDTVQHIVTLDEYTKEQMELIVLQRLKYANIEYESETVLEDIVLYGQCQLGQSIRFLQLSVSVMLSDNGRQILTSDDVKKAARLSRLDKVIGDEIPF